MRTLVWLFRAAVFFTLFAFALNNTEPAKIRWFFGYEWQGPLIFIVLVAFGIGCAFGIVAMVPSWWRHRRFSRTHARRAGDTAVVASPPAAVETPEPHPPRDGL